MITLFLGISLTVRSALDYEWKCWSEKHLKKEKAFSYEKGVNNSETEKIQ